MPVKFTPPLLLLALLGACADNSVTKPVEFLDDRSGMTVGALRAPIELVPGTPLLSHVGNHISFAYLGPVEWDRMGVIEYGLWVHIAPGSDRQVADIRAPAALTLVLDDGSIVLSPIDAPQLGRSPYDPVASWGQTAYFELSVPLLKRMAGSAKLELDVRGGDAVVSFLPSADTRPVLRDYLKDRSIDAD
jgi:hypothetical protein